MKSLGLCPRLPVMLLLASGMFVTGCSQKMLRQVSKVAGEEAAYAALRSVLVANRITSADHFVGAVRLVVEKKDYGGAAAAFTVALAEHNLKAANKLSSSEVVSMMRQAEPVVKRASPRVASSLTSFCSYVEEKK